VNILPFRKCLSGFSDATHNIIHLAKRRPIENLVTKNNRNKIKNITKKQQKNWKEKGVTPYYSQ